LRLGKFTLDERCVQGYLAHTKKRKNLGPYSRTMSRAIW